MSKKYGNNLNSTWILISTWFHDVLTPDNKLAKLIYQMALNSVFKHDHDLKFFGPRPTINFTVRNSFFLLGCLDSRR